MSGAVATRANRSERLDARVAFGCQQPMARDYHRSARRSARARPELAPIFVLKVVLCRGPLAEYRSNSQSERWHEQLSVHCDV